VLECRKQELTDPVLQVEFDDMHTNKRRRVAAGSPHAPDRPDVLSGIIGKRVVVPRRSRSAMPASQTQQQRTVVCAPPPEQAPHEQAPPEQAPPQSDMSLQPPSSSHQPDICPTHSATQARRSPAPRDEEQFAVMGLLSLCTAS
jgi:hypothetical protein